MAYLKDLFREENDNYRKGQAVRLGFFSTPGDFKAVNYARFWPFREAQLAHLSGIYIGENSRSISISQRR
jgi:hypothetical protein